MNINELQLDELRRFAALGRLSASILHEITNPLTAAMLQLELSDHASPTIRKAKRNMQVLRRYVEAARQQIDNRSNNKNFSLQPQIDQLKRVLQPIARQATVKLVFNTTPTNCKLHGDPVKLQQIIANLVVNAVQSYSEIPNQFPAPLIQVKLSVSDEFLLIHVTDWGKGIAAPELPKIFDPFYTTKGETDAGLGLGLAIVKQHVTADFGGSIKVMSTGRGGTQFVAKIKRYNY